MGNDYEQQLREENEKLREKLAEALKILDNEKIVLEENAKKYGANKSWTNNWTIKEK